MILRMPVAYFMQGPSKLLPQNTQSALKSEHLGSTTVGQRILLKTLQLQLAKAQYSFVHGYHVQVLW